MALVEAYPPLSLFIDGTWHRGEGRQNIDVVNPATGEVLGRLPMATKADIDEALSSADRGFQVWKRVTALERARIISSISSRIRENADRLARIVTMEQGKCLSEALQEIHNTADTFEWMAEEGKRAYGRVVPSRLANADQYVRLEPMGPVAALSPWNFPAVLACRKVATALAAGCSVVIKPAEETPGIMLAIARICQEAGLPKGVLNVVYGDPSEISDQLIRSPIIKKISFTGSVPVGRLLAEKAASYLKKITLELGGHSPVIITDGVDVERMVGLTLTSKFRNAGQLCLCPTRFFVHESLHDDFVAGLAAGAAALRIGNGLNSKVQMGPLANKRRVEAMREFCQDAASRGARIHAGGKSPGAMENGYYWEPTIISELPSDALAMLNEPFGPLALVSPYTDLDDALQRANATEYGLASYAFTNSLSSARQIEHGMEAGNVSINTYAISPPELPFSGIKSSGLGHEMGSEGLQEHMHVKAVIRAVLE